MATERRPAIVAVDDEPAVLARRRARPAARLRRALPDPARRLGRRGARAARASCARRGDQVAMLIADQRMPGMSGTEYLVEARKLVPGRQARAADRVRRHRGGDRGDQRGRARLLPAQAVGPAGGAAVPGRRGPADHLGGRRGARGRRRARDRPPLLARTRTTCATSSPATASRRAGSTSSATARRASCCRSPGVADDRLPVALLEDGTRARAADGARARRAARRRRPAGAGPLRPGDRRRRPGRAGGGGLRRVRGAAHRDGRARGAGRAGRAVEPDRELPRLPGRAQRLRARAPRHRPGATPRRRAPERSGRRRRCASRARAGSSTSATAAR